MASTNGMITTLGKTVSNWILKSVTSGKIERRLPSIGVTANPGRSTASERDQMAITTMSDIDPLPVLICIIMTFYSDTLCKGVQCRGRVQAGRARLRFQKKGISR